MRSTMVSWTWPTLPSFRFRFELLLEARWRSPGLRRRILPVPVTLNRFAADFLVLRRAIDLGIFLGRRTLGRDLLLATVIFGKSGASTGEIPLGRRRRLLLWGWRMVPLPIESS